MKTFEVEAQRIDSYKIIIDENIWNEKALSEWRGVFASTLIAHNVPVSTQ